MTFERQHPYVGVLKLEGNLLMNVHSGLTNFSLRRDRLGPSASFTTTALGMALIQLLMEEPVVCALLGAIDAAPSKSPLPALDRYLLARIGADVAQDDPKRFIGRLVRQIVEHLGGTHVRDGADIQVASIFTTGSIYSLPTTQRFKGDAAARRQWAIAQIQERGLNPHY